MNHCDLETLYAECIAQVDAAKEPNPVVTSEVVLIVTDEIRKASQKRIAAKRCWQHERALREQIRRRK